MQYERVYKVLQSRYLRADTYLDSPLLDMYLWNRNLYHKDFLMYRIGIGDVEFPMKIDFLRKCLAMRKIFYGGKQKR